MVLLAAFYLLLVNQSVLAVSSSCELGELHQDGQGVTGALLQSGRNVSRTVSAEEPRNDRALLNTSRSTVQARSFMAEGAHSDQEKKMGAEVHNLTADAPTATATAEAWELYFTSSTLWVVALLILELCLLVTYYRMVGLSNIAEVPARDESDESASSLWMWLRKDDVKKLVWPYLMSSTLAGQYIGLLCSLMVFQCCLDFKYNQWELYFWDVVYARRSSALVEAVVCFLVLLAANTVTVTFAENLRGFFALHFREFHTKNFTTQAFLKNNHLVLKLQGASSCAEDELDNIEQRIQEDVDHFTSSVVETSWDFVYHILYLCIFSWIVIVHCPSQIYGHGFLPGWPIFLCTTVCALGMSVAHWVGKPLVRINKLHEKREANFRKTLGHIEENAESIALCGSADVEQARVLRNFDDIKSISSALLYKSAALKAVTASADYLEWMLPFLILAPLFFRQEISFGELFQLSSALSHVNTSLDWFLSSTQCLTDLRASAERLVQLKSCLSAAADEWLKAPPSRQAVSASLCKVTDQKNVYPPVLVDGVQINLPDGEQLWHSLSLRLDHAQRVMISGGEGQGKSTIFKAIAGIWPYVQGGKILLHEDHYFMPQHPVLPSRCSLREALCYPDPPDTYSGEALLWAIREVKLLRLLINKDTVAMKDDDDAESLSDREPEAEDLPSEAEEDDGIDMTEDEMLMALNKEASWKQCLSGGMQQRLLFAHVLLRKPMVVFLDEATCHVSKTSAVELYGSLYRNLSESAVVITISHDTGTLLELHNTHYIVVGKGRNKRLHLAERRMFSVQHVEPGMFVAVLQQGEWDEVLLCAQFPTSPSSQREDSAEYWLACTTDQTGQRFIWVAVGLKSGTCLPVSKEGGAVRSVNAYMDDDINWICTPPACEALWCPSQFQIHKLIEEAVQHTRKLEDVPWLQLDDATLASMFIPPKVAFKMEPSTPGMFTLVSLGAEWIEMLLCQPLNTSETHWLCRGTDDYGDAFVWTVAVLEQGCHARVNGIGADRSSTADISTETISWICEPPECEAHWCPSTNEIRDLQEESKQLLERIDHSKFESWASEHARSSIVPLDQCDFFQQDCS